MTFPKIDRLSLRFSACIAVLVLFGQGITFFFVYRYASARLLESSRQQAAMTTRLVHQALEDGMLNKDDRLVRKMVDSFGTTHGVQRVLILDREGEVRFSSDPSIEASHFDRDSATCMVCHSEPAEKRARSAMLEIEGGRTLRVVDPIENKAECYACHDASQRMNGMMVVDVKLDEALANLQQAISHLAVASSIVGVMLLGGAGLIFRQLLVGRLRRFEDTARAIEDGDLGRRVAVSGNDALGRVEQRFNGMADAVFSFSNERGSNRPIWSA
ncbi:MAG: HAMP domain-containing protein [Deltaproteobacteria bacterium]|nr:HAMP domain-containing protein [Deltaproteobacteria bacterium]